MSNTARWLAILALLTMLAMILWCSQSGPRSGTYTINVFEYVPSHPSRNMGDSIPNVWIDTHLRLSSLTGGTLTSSLPCAVKIDYTDSSLAVKAAIFTALKVTYDDNTTDPSAAALGLPLRIAARDYESVNSVADGRIVKSRTSIVFGAIPNVITRAGPLRLQIEGHFVKGDGSRIPFVIDQHFDIKAVNTVKSSGEVLQDK